ncbi:hydroxymethylglutaryl-CoA lyase [uncultured Caballeronia sp.]|uniref:hydroxymethylglutaryl-CoA lyase n=1 Tax=uncultured Caballeronia sp. TaxID=1827198 RepID=UPI0015756EB9
MSHIEIVDVAPRDGLQGLHDFVPTQRKIEFIHKLASAGFQRMEVTSFVSPKHVPQMADAAEVVAGLGDLPGLVKMALVPNALGARRALKSGVRSLIFVISMTDAHNMSNVRRTTQASIDDLSALTEELSDTDVELRVGLGTAFHCPFTGLVDERQVLENIQRILKIRDNIEFAVSDTTGMATPDHVLSLCKSAISLFGGTGTWSYHGHDTAGFGLANVLAAIEAGITSFDASAGGLGGCPFAPGATGNIATEDIVHLLHRMGMKTGIDLPTLLEAADMAVEISGAPTGSHARGLPRERLIALEQGAAAAATA